jgi:arsenate reductase-like glutaredoxin family protein
MSKTLEGVLRRILGSACEEHKASLTDLTVLSAQVDPYRIDTVAGHRDGQWLAEQLAKLYGSAQRAHWRGINYAIVADGNIVKPNDEIYRNTNVDWEWLITNPAKAARCLGYVPFDRIIDQRNAAPIIHRKPRVNPEARLSIGLDVEIPDAEDIEPLPIARGFVVRQAFHFGIFGEKSSLEDVVLAIAEQFEADLYLPTGEISDTLVYQIAKEANDDGRSLVLFTLSDCDPAGHQMPVSIARKLQAFRDLFFPDLCFEVARVALTPEQVEAENLPSTPLKDTEKRASRWRDAFGIDQTEIDALTTPAKRNVLQQILRRAFKPYIDSTLSRRVAEAKTEWDTAAQEAVNDQIDTEHLARIRDEASTKLDELREQIDEITAQLDLVAGEHFTLPPIEVPEPEVELDPLRHVLVSFEDDWVSASQALIKHKAYGRD